MSKNHKKRNKPYRGADAATGPHVTRYSVGKVNPVKVWWQENKRGSLWRLILVLLALFVSWLIYVVIN